MNFFSLLYTIHRHEEKQVSCQWNKHCVIVPYFNNNWTKNLHHLLKLCLLEGFIHQESDMWDLCGEQTTEHANVSAVGLPRWEPKQRDTVEKKHA